VVLGDDAPEVHGDVVVEAAAGLFPHAHAGDDLRDGGVGVQPVELVFPGR
jgi:hypothetical protein